MLEIVSKDDAIIRNYVPDDYYKGRVCCECKNSKTYIKESGKPQWYGCACGKKDCTGHLCNKCWLKIAARLPDSHRNMMKSIADYRIGNVRKDSDYGISMISQAVVVKTLKIEDLTIKTNNLKYYIDAEHNEHGKIDVKSSTLQQYGIYDFASRMKIDCDTYICLGYDMNRRNIGDVYIIPNDGWICNLRHIGIPKNPSKTSKYDKFKVDPKPYNDEYHDLVLFLKYNAYFGMEDIKKWLNMIK